MRVTKLVDLLSSDRIAV